MRNEDKNLKIDIDKVLNDQNDLSQSLAAEIQAMNKSDMKSILTKMDNELKEDRKEIEEKIRQQYEKEQANKPTIQAQSILEKIGKSNISEPSALNRYAIFAQNKGPYPRPQPGEPDAKAYSNEQNVNTKPFNK